MSVFGAAVLTALLQGALSGAFAEPVLGQGDRRAPGAEQGAALRQEHVPPAPRQRPQPAAGDRPAQPHRQGLRQQRQTQQVRWLLGCLPAYT